MLKIAIYGLMGGYFLFKKDIFKYIDRGEELVLEPFQRLIARQQLFSYKYTGFFGVMDTFKGKATARRYVCSRR